MGSSLQLDELDEVVGEDAVGAPGAGAGVAAEAGATPGPVAFEMGDASFASGAPFHGVDEVVGTLDAGAGRGGFAGARDDHRGHPGSDQVGFDGRIPVAPIGGDQ